MNPKKSIDERDDLFGNDTELSISHSMFHENPAYPATFPPPTITNMKLNPTSYLDNKVIRLSPPTLNSICSSLIV